MSEGRAPGPARRTAHEAAGSGAPRRGAYRAVAVALLIVHAMLVARIGYVNSPTMDEVGHLPAGLSIAVIAGTAT